MHLNFANISPRHFLLALDNADGTVCGFCVLGSKPAVNSKTFTQLLSITRPSHRRRGIYQGLSRLIGSAVSTSATLLNVTHAQNIAIQQAYQQSGRAHVADTVVIRRVLSSTDRR
jgi:hypothetical protein